MTLDLSETTMSQSVHLYVGKSPEDTLLKESATDDSRESWAAVFKHLESTDAAFGACDDSNWEFLKRSALRRGWKVVRAHMVEIDGKSLGWSPALELKEAHKRLAHAKQRASFLADDLRFKDAETKRVSLALKQMTATAERTQRTLAELFRRASSVALPRQLKTNVELALKNKIES
jgi:hypothetical protein